MSYTRYALRIYEALESGDWRSGAEIASLISTPHKSLKTALERLLSDGVIERNVNRNPMQYRRVLQPKGEAARAAAVLSGEIAKERMPPDLRMRKDDPRWQEMSAQAVGYCGLILPRENHFHGLFIMPGREDEADDMIARFRDRIGEVENEPLANMFAAALAALVSGEFGRDPSVESRLLPPLHAIRKLLDSPYFFITAENDEAGYRTQINIVAQSEITMAQVVLQRSPSEYMTGLMDKREDVIAIKQRRAIIQRQN